MKFPRFITLLSSVLLASCASGAQPKAPPNLLNTEWLLEDLAGRGVLDRIQATLAFPGPNKVAGNGSCNTGPALKSAGRASSRMYWSSKSIRRSLTTKPHRRNSRASEPIVK